MNQNKISFNSNLKEELKFEFTKIIFNSFGLTETSVRDDRSLFSAFVLSWCTPVRDFNWFVIFNNVGDVQLRVHPLAVSENENLIFGDVQFRVHPLAISENESLIKG